MYSSNSTSLCWPVVCRIQETDKGCWSLFWRTIVIKAPFMQHLNITFSIMNDITAIKGIDGLHGNSFSESGSSWLIIVRWELWNKEKRTKYRIRGLGLKFTVNLGERMDLTLMIPSHVWEKNLKIFIPVVQMLELLHIWGRTKCAFIFGTKPWDMKVLYAEELK